jgi:hypothetical protein
MQLLLLLYLSRRSMRAKADCGSVSAFRYACPNEQPLSQAHAAEMDIEPPPGLLPVRKGSMRRIASVISPADSSHRILLICKMAASE